MRQKTARVETEETYVPRYFYGVHKFINLTAGVVFVNGVPFLVTLSKKIQIFTVQFLPSRTSSQVISHLTKVVKIYVRGAFYIRTILMDQEFDKVVENTAAAQEHVGGIERNICFIKEIFLGTRLIMRFKHISKSFVVHLVYFSVMWINSFPAT